MRKRAGNCAVPFSASGYEDAISQTFSRAEFVGALDQLVEEHPITTCDVTVFGMGVVYVRLEFGPGVEPQLMNGLLAAYEYAGHRDDIAKDPRSVAEATVALAITAAALVLLHLQSPSR